MKDQHTSREAPHIQQCDIGNLSFCRQFDLPRVCLFFKMKQSIALDKPVVGLPRERKRLQKMPWYGTIRMRIMGSNNGSPQSRQVVAHNLLHVILSFEWAKIDYLSFPFLNARAMLLEMKHWQTSGFQYSICNKQSAGAQCQVSPVVNCENEAYPRALLMVGGYFTQDWNLGGCRDPRPKC